MDRLFVMLRQEGQQAANIPETHHSPTKAGHPKPGRQLLQTLQGTARCRLFGEVPQPNQSPASLQRAGQSLPAHWEFRERPHHQNSRLNANLCCHPGITLHSSGSDQISRSHKQSITECHRKQRRLRHQRAQTQQRNHLKHPPTTWSSRNSHASRPSESKGRKPKA